MSNEEPGLMIVVDASCLYEVLIGAPGSGPIRHRLAADPDHAAPHVVDVEVFSVIRRDFLSGRLDRTEASLAVDDLQAWPAERFSHRFLLARAWELRETVRGWDAMYIALAELMDAPLLTTDLRLAKATGPRCQIEAFGA
jgi:predicted nucleic acid-binding protein